MHRLSFISLLLLLTAMGAGTGCRDASGTAGRPAAESRKLPGSVIATRAGTGDPRVGPRGSDAGSPATHGAPTSPDAKQPNDKDTTGGKEAAPAHR